MKETGKESEQSPYGESEDGQLDEEPQGFSGNYAPQKHPTHVDSHQHGYSDKRSQKESSPCCHDVDIPQGPGMGRGWL